MCSADRSQYTEVVTGLSEGELKDVLNSIHCCHSGRSARHQSRIDPEIG